MKAWLATAYGGPEVLELAEVPTPEPGPGEILVAIRATTVASGDWRVRSLIVPRGFGPFARLALGLRRPRQPILGTDFAGVVAGLGSGVTNFVIGDRVVGFPGGAMGCHAQFRTMPADGRVVKLPDTLSFAEGAALPFGGSTALSYLRRCAARPGETMLVIGASGAVGAMLVQLGRQQGLKITAVSSAGNGALVTTLGAERAIDYGATDILALPERYDIIADCVAATSFRAARHLLAPGGRYLAIAGGLLEMMARPWQGRRVVAGPADERRDDLEDLATLAGAGSIKAVIDSVFAFADLPKAHERVDTGRKRGAVIVALD
jgi:NADPH:quinone reductase-like Zn-dependent oxidoreductase